MFWKRISKRLGLLVPLLLVLAALPLEAWAQKRIYARVEPNKDDTTPRLVFDVNIDPTDNVAPNIVFSTISAVGECGLVAAGSPHPTSFSVYAGTPKGSGRESPGRKPWDQGPVGRKPCKGDTETQRRPYRADSDCRHPTQGSHPGLSLLSPFRAWRGAANNFEPMCSNSRSTRKYQDAFALYWKLPGHEP